VSTFSEYQNTIVLKMVQNCLSQENSVQIGISVHETYLLEPVLNNVRFTTPDRELLRK
jgi:hypothetical protein